MLASAMALLLIAGGGGIGLLSINRPAPAPISATVNDLQLLDKNVQAEQQVDQILEDSATGQDNSNGAAPPQS
jgi:hypothetical protein